MRTVSVLIGRARRPDSPHGPRELLPDDAWAQFQAEVRAALIRWTDGDPVLEVAHSETEWMGQHEPAITFTRVNAIYTPYDLGRLDDELAIVGYRFDQAAIVFGEGKRRLVLANPPF